MLVLVYPMWSNDNIAGDSNFVFLYSLLGEIVRKRPDYNFFMVFPSGAKVPEPDLFKHNIFPITKRLPSGKRKMCSNFDAQFFWNMDKEIPFDFVFNQVVEVGHLIKGTLRSKPEKHETPVINQHHYVIHPTLPEYAHLDFLEIAQAAGSLLADVNVFNSKYTKSMLKDLLDKHLHAANTAKIMTSSRVIEMGTLPDDFEKYQEQKFDKFTFVYNHRIATYKRTEDTFAVFDKLHSEGYDFQVIVTGADSGNLASVAKRPYVRVVQLQTREAYFRFLSKCHANVINSVHETFCIAITESMLFEHVVIAPRRCTFPELLGEDYPLLFNSVDEEYAMVKKTLEGQFQQLGKANQARAVKLFTRSRYADRYIELFDRFKTPPALEGIREPSKREKIIKAVRGRSALSMRDATNIVYDAGFSSQSFMPRKIKSVMNDLGYKEVFDGKRIVFTK